MKNVELIFDDDTGSVMTCESNVRQISEKEVCIDNKYYIEFPKIIIEVNELDE